METPATRIRRLTAALHDLSSQVSVSLENREIEAVLDVMERGRPLVDEIARLSLQPGVAATLDSQTQESARRLMDLQRLQGERLEQLKREVTDELAELTLAQSRTQRFRGAYAGSRPPHSSTTLLG